MSNNEIKKHTPSTEPMRVLLRGGPLDGERIVLSPLTKYVVFPTADYGQLRYLRDLSVDGAEPVYVFAAEH